MSQAIQTAPLGHYRVTQVVKSEVAKIVTLRSTAITLAVTVVAGLLVTGLVTNAAATGYVLTHTGTLGLNGYSAGGYSSGGFGNRSSGPREMFTAPCSSCGREARVPFRPTNGKPVYCSDCFRAQRGG